MSKIDQEIIEFYKNKPEIPNMKISKKEMKKLLKEKEDRLNKIYAIISWKKLKKLFNK